MKSVKWFVTTGVLVTSSLLLVACGGGKAKDTSTYSYVYMSDPTTLDYTVSNRAVDSDVAGNLVDGLMETDKYGNLVPSLAKDWTVSKDGLTYTYKLRKDAKWYTSEGEEYADVKAEDFVTGLKHAVDAKSEAIYLVQNSVKGLDAYIKGEDKDFSHVGIKALDDHTIQYTLNQPESFWNSKTTMGILFPINAEFLKSQGKNFGAPKTSGILSNGPYLLKSLTSKSSIEYAKNPGYYDKDNVHVENVKLTFYDGSDQESLARGFSDGSYTIGAVYPNSSNYASIKKKYKDNIVYGPQNGTSYYYAFNLNRQAYNHTAKTSDGQKNATKEALLNKDFRQALNFAFNRTPYLAQVNGEDAANKQLRNTLVPPTFVQVGDKSFGSVVESKLQAYGDEWSGVKLDDAQDAFYSPEKAKAKLAKAKEALQAQGVEFPIHLDTPVNQSNTAGVQQAQSLKQSIESVLGKENVVIDIHQMSEDEEGKITYYAETAAQKDYDLAIGGWSADYQDPSSYLDIFNSAGASLNQFGLEAKDAAIIEKLGLADYEKLNQAADAITTDTDTRYEKYAESQAWLTDSSLILPYQSLGGRASLTKVKPFTKAYSWVGIKGEVYTFKYLEVQADPVTTKDYDAAYKKWQKEKEESNAKAKEELKKHIAD
ncbi:peptide ABC transporter substrate-binding protein [Streptococcus oricebi]|uniref:Peptide ABC transporter ATP-binding protein n=1 Tax=Streptococcus oricebi TaxID=1547447 RepID=A0ABS5B5K5_9STRE|nr:peptide ABC transporter substrate-binding protein [Streptococcus oricebi]MBP2624090.1 peptide ABC transporter ATP-binding protein [Streptococcus oricebi]